MLGGVAYVSDSANDIVWAVSLSTGAETRVAGTGVAGWSGDGGPARAAELNMPMGLAAGPGPSLYIADSGNNRVQRVDLATGIITTVAGGGQVGSSGDGGPAVDASLGSPDGVALSPGGHTLYIADTLGNQVRAVDLATGIITTVAGNGSHGYSGDGGPATSASLSFPEAVAVSAGTLYIADTDNSVVRAVDLATGIITTIAGDGLAGYSGNGGPARHARLSFPAGLALGGGFLYIADHDNGAVRAVDLSTGIITTLAGTGVLGYSGEGGPATLAAFDDPTGLALVPGNPAPAVRSSSSPPVRLLVADTGNLRLRSVDLVTGMVSTVAGNGSIDFSGDGGPATRAQLAVPSSVAVSPGGTLYVADTGNGRVRSVDLANGRISTVAGGGVAGFAGGGGLAKRARLQAPAGVALSPRGHTLYVADELGQRVMAVDLATGRIHTVAGNGVAGCSGGSGLASRASLDDPTGVAVSPDGHVLYIADSGSNLVLAVDLATGRISTVAGNVAGCPGGGALAKRGSLDDPTGVAVSPDGHVLYIADMLANRVQAVDLRTGRVTTVAGPGTATPLAFPWGVAVGSTGDLFVADKDANRVQVLVAHGGRVAATVAGVTVAGTGALGYASGGGVPRRAVLDQPTGVALGPRGNLYIADGGNGRVRKVTDPLAGLDVGQKARWAALPPVLPVPKVLAAPSLSLPEAAGGLSPPPGVTSASSGSGVKSGGTLEVAVMGDSVALTLGTGLAEVGASYGSRVEDDGVLGCGVLATGAIVNSGVTYPATPLCRRWPAIWRADVASQHPDVVALLIGRWEAVDRQVGGRWSHVGKPAFDALLAASLEQAIGIASSDGARVVLLSAPYYQLGGDPAAGLFPETNPIRVDEINSLLSVLPRLYPGVVSFLDLNALLDPGGHWSLVVGGVVARWAEGVHVTALGGELVAPVVMPALRAAGAGSRAAA